VTGATGYDIWYGGPPSPTSTPDTSVGAVTTTLWTNAPSGTQTYYVRAKNANGNGAWSSPGVSGTRLSMGGGY
jgi:hypothetical protein